MAVFTLIVLALTVISVQSAPIAQNEVVLPPAYMVARPHTVPDLRIAQLNDFLSEYYPLLKREIAELKEDERFIIEKLRGALSDAVKRGEISTQQARDVVIEIVKAAKENRLQVLLLLKELLDRGVKAGILDRTTALKVFVNAILEKVHKKVSGSSAAVDKALENAVDARIISEAAADRLKELEGAILGTVVVPELAPYTMLVVGGQMKDAINDILSGHGPIIDKFRANFRNAIRDGLLSRSQVAEVMREVIRAIKYRKLNVIGRINEFLDKAVQDGIIDSDTRLAMLLKAIRERYHETAPDRLAAINTTVNRAEEVGIISARTAKKLKELSPVVEILDDEILPF